MKPIIGHEEYFVTENGEIYSNKSGSLKKRKLYQDKHGYWKISFYGWSPLYLHRIMAEAFIPNPMNKPCVNHKNGDKEDCRIENLEWVTIQENSDHAHEIGLVNNVGEKNPSAKITKTQVKEILDILESKKLAQLEIANQFGVTVGTISKIKTKRIWKHINAK